MTRLRFDLNDNDKRKNSLRKKVFAEFSKNLENQKERRRLELNQNLLGKRSLVHNIIATIRRYEEMDCLLFTYDMRLETRIIKTE